MSSLQASGGRRRRLALTWLVALGATFADIAIADHKQSFREGIEAFDQKNWSNVVHSMQEAIAQNPQAGERVKLYGVRFQTYLPYYYLGLAQFHLGDCTAAIEAWNASEQQAAVAGKLLKDLKAKRGECEQQPDVFVEKEAETPAGAEVEKEAETPAGEEIVIAAVGRATGQLESSAAAAEELARLRADPELASVFEADPDLAREESEAGEQLSQARERLAVGREAGDAVVVEEAGDLASRAEDRFRDISRRATARRDELVRMAEAEVPEESQVEVMPPPTLPPPTLPPPPVVPQVLDAEEIERRGLRIDLERRAESARRLLDRPVGGSEISLRESRNALEAILADIRRVGSESSSEDLETLRGRLLRGTDAYEAAVEQSSATIETAEQQGAETARAQPPSELRSAATAFFGADYLETISILEKASFVEPKAEATGRLLSAASRYSLYLQGGRKDETLRQLARTTIASFRWSDVAIRPDAKWFSPAFIRFFESAAR